MVMNKKIRKLFAYATITTKDLRQHGKTLLGLVEQETIEIAPSSATST